MLCFLLIYNVQNLVHSCTSKRKRSYGKCPIRQLNLKVNLWKIPENNNSKNIVAYPKTESLVTQSFIQFGVSSIGFLLKKVILVS